MNLDDIKEILTLVREHELEEFELERDGLKVRVRKAGSAQHPHVAIMPPAVSSGVVPAVAVPPVGAPLTQAAAVPQPIEAGGVELAVIKSPIVGTLYLSAEPGARPFVQIGDTVKK